MDKKNKELPEEKENTEFEHNGTGDAFVETEMPREDSGRDISDKDLDKDLENFIKTKKA